MVVCGGFTTELLLRGTEPRLSLTAEVGDVNLIILAVFENAYDDALLQHTTYKDITWSTQVIRI